jgi:uncharacterized membrane-anchored protein YhcB (DUF1043 family)
MWYFIVFIIGIALGAAGVWFATRKYKKQINDLLEKVKFPEGTKP